MSHTQIDFVDSWMREESESLNLPYLIDRPEQVAPVLAKLAQALAIGFDTETTGLAIWGKFDYRTPIDLIKHNPDQDIMVGFSFATDTGDNAWYVPVYHRRYRCLPFEEWFPLFQACLKVPKIYIHNAGFDCKVVSQVYGKDMAPHMGVYDTLVACHTLFQGEESGDKTLRNQLGLKKLVKRFFNKEMKEFDKDWLGEKAFIVPMPEMARYGADDGIGVMLVGPWAEGECRKNMTHTYLNQVGLPLIRTISKIHNGGIHICRDDLIRMRNEAGYRMQELTNIVRVMAGPKLNIDSKAQMENFLYNEVGIPQICERTPSGKRKTSADILQKALRVGIELTKRAEERENLNIQDMEDLSMLDVNYRLPPINDDVKQAIEAYLDYCDLKKVQSTFLNPLLRRSAYDGKIYYTLKQTGTVSGRFSSENPNMQQLPSRKTTIAGINLDVRSAFRPDPGHLFITLDESNLEMRILAHESNELVLIESLHLPKDAGGDPHSATGAKLAGYSLKRWYEMSAVQKDENGKVIKDKHGEPIPVDPKLFKQAKKDRGVGKTMNFGIIYGLGPPNMAEKLGVTVDQTKEFIAQYFRDLPGVDKWKQDLEAYIMRHGYIRTLKKRIRRTSLHKSANRSWREGAVRSLINAQIQGGAADVVNSAMVRIANDPSFIRSGARLVLQVHDEIVISCPKEAVDDVLGIARAYMMFPFSPEMLRVPLMVDGGISDRWTH